MDLNTIVKNVIVTRYCSFKPDGDSTESKTVTLKIKVDGVPLKAVFDKAGAATAVQWQNGKARKNYDTFKEGQVVEVDFKAPAATQINPVTQLLAEAAAANIDTTDTKALTEYIRSRLNK